MVNDPAQILDLADRLDDLTVAIAKADRFEDVHDAVRSNWKLRPEVFAAIKSAVAAPADRDRLHAQIAAAVRPLARDGILGAGTLPPNEESSRTLSVRQKGEPRARAAWSRGNASSPNGWRSPTGRSARSSAAPSARTRSGRSSSA